MRLSKELVESQFLERPLAPNSVLVSWPDVPSHKQNDPMTSDLLFLITAWTTYPRPYGSFSMHLARILVLLAKLCEVDS